MFRQLARIVCAAAVSLAACNITDPVCFDEPDCDPEPGPIEAADQPAEPNRSAAPPEASCNADSLDGLSCDCEGLHIDVVTLGGEIVSDGQHSILLDQAGNAMGSNFDICRDQYTWEGEGPDCALVVIRTDRGCGGLALQPTVDDGGRMPSCPYIDDGKITALCTEVRPFDGAFDLRGG